MRRRNFMTVLAGAGAYPLLAGAAFVRPIAADAQPAAGVPRIGLLMGSSPRDEATKLDALRGALEKLGYIDGQTILIEVRYAMGQPDRFASLARELVVLAPPVIACVGRRETTGLPAGTHTLPIVLRQVHDPGEQGLFASLARPRCHATGFTQTARAHHPSRV